MTYRIWGRHPGLPGDAGRWGIVRPQHLSGELFTDLEIIAQRYRETYPEQQFVVSKTKPAD